MATSTETRDSRVGFNVTWRKEWPMLEQFSRLPRSGEKVTIFPRMELPSDHPIVLIYREYFR